MPDIEFSTTIKHLVHLGDGGEGDISITHAAVIDASGLAMDIDPDTLRIISAGGLQAAVDAIGNLGVKININEGGKADA